jgi:hypothetical protein
LSEQSTHLRVEATASQVRVFRTADPSAPVVVQNARPDHRPFIHPILPPGGSGPVTEDAPAHHPWQHGLYVGLNDVNGYGFWLEGLRPEHAATDGTFHPRLVGDARADGDSASWTVETEYRDPAGGALLTETQSWRLTDRVDRFDLDVDWTLAATVPVRFGAYEYGGLFLRMPYRDEAGGSALNSEGSHNADTEGATARWVACRMPIDGNPEDAFVAVMDHPGNLRHPAPWRVDHQLGVCPSVCIAGEWTLAGGESRTFRHRVSVFERPVRAAEIDSVWAEFSTEATPLEGAA